LSRPEIGCLQNDLKMELKDQIIQEYLNTGCGYRKLQEKYGVGRSTICNWVQVYQGVQGLAKTSLQQKHYISPMKRKQKQADADQAALLEKIALLERRLKDEELRTIVLDKLIDVAEKQLDISIRKKPGTQQSSK
jgi:transposase